MSPPQNPEKTSSRMKPYFQCRTTSEVERAIGQDVRVEGVCEIRPFHSAKGVLIAEWPGVRLDDDGFVLIGSFWQRSTLPPDPRALGAVGLRIEVFGRLHGSPPGSVQNIAIPCVLPVEDVRVAGTVKASPES